MAPGRVHGEGVGSSDDDQGGCGDCGHPARGCCGRWDLQPSSKDREDLDLGGARRTQAGVPILLRHVPRDTAGPVLVAPALPSGPSLLSGRGYLAPPAQGVRWWVATLTRLRTAERSTWGQRPPRPAASIPAFPAAPNSCPSILLSARLPLPRPHLLSTLAAVTFLSPGSREALPGRLKVRPEDKGCSYLLTSALPDPPRPPPFPGVSSCLTVPGLKCRETHVLGTVQILGTGTP